MFSRRGNLQTITVQLLSIIYICNKYTEMVLTNSPVTFSENAINELKKLMNQPEYDTTKHLRIGVKGGGCSGMTYILGFDDKTAEDEVYTFEDLTFVMNKSHGLYLFGMSIDWSDGLNSRGFTFTNPNASKTCGCGTSFSV